MFEFVVSKKGLKESEARYSYIPSVFAFIVLLKCGQNCRGCCPTIVAIIHVHPDVTACCEDHGKMRQGNSSA